MRRRCPTGGVEAALGRRMRRGKRGSPHSPAPEAAAASAPPLPRGGARRGRGLPGRAMAGGRGWWSSWRLLGAALVLLALAGPGAWSARSRSAEKQNSLRRAASGAYQGVSGLFGEENVRGLQKFFSRMTERFVYGVDVLVDTLWRIWADLLDVLGIDGSNLSHYFSPGSLANNPTRALLLIGAILLAYWFVSLLLGFFFYLLHVMCGRFFWIVRVALFALSCVYILQKYEGEPEHAVLPLCFVVAVYFMTGPVGFYWRRSSHSTLEEKIDHLDSQIRLLNIRLSRVIENMDRGGDQ